ncbi:hypothetical protein [Tessaracoccus timonensis]|uniref:hypothetical protein n=1 Tax=Tessaracoccus timonensis TaxID=2161816 RepID=UPI000D55C3FD|nr:hypothetical protein [Tessaracoccus timonensis]
MSSRERFAVEINPLLPDTLRVSLTLRRFGGGLLMFLGGSMLIMVIVGTIARERSTMTTGDVLTTALAALMLAGLVALGAALLFRRSRYDHLVDQKHAFLITPEHLEFPARNDGPAAVWPLDKVTTSSTPGQTGRLVLRCPGFPTRQYANIHLKETPAEVQARIMAAQRALAQRDRPAT